MISVPSVLLSPSASVSPGPKHRVMARNSNSPSATHFDIVIKYWLFKKIARLLVALRSPPPSDLVPLLRDAPGQVGTMTAHSSGMAARLEAKTSR